MYGRLSALGGGAAWLYAAAALFTPLQSSAQTFEGRITGQVVDSITGAPVPAVLVRLPAFHREELTHEDGTFEITRVPAGEHVLVAQRVGYRLQSQRVTVGVGQELTVVIRLPPFVAQLAPMVVTGTVTERSRDELVSNTTVLSGAELDRQLASTLASTIEQQPGVAMTSMGPATGQPVIRGLSGDRIVVLEDGSRPGDLSSMPGGDHAVAVDPTSARRVEIVRGPMSLLYGSSALGGVVNVVREEIPESLPEHAHGSVTLTGASVDRAGTATGTLLTRLGSLALRGEGTVRQADDIRTPGGALTNTSATMYSFGGGAGLVPSWGHVGASYRYYDNDYGIPGGFIGGHENGVNILMRRHAARAAAEWHRESHRVSRLQTSASYTNYRHFELEATGAVGTLFRQQQGAVDLVATLDSAGILGEGAIGAHARYREITTGGSLRTPSTDDYSLAAFAVEELLLGGASVQGGVRADYARYTPREQATISVGGREVAVRPRSFFAVSASLGTLYPVSSTLRLGASISRAFRTPNFNELYSNGPHLAANSFEVGDPELRAETGHGAEVFVRLAAPRVRAEFAAFYNAMDDYIAPASRGRVERGTQGSVPRLQFTNTDALLRGAEGTIEWSVARSVIAGVTLSHVEARFTERRDSIPIFSGTDTTFVAASRYPPLIPPLHGVMSLRHETPRYFASADLAFAGAQQRLGDFETATAGYAVLGVDAGVRFVAGPRLHHLTIRADNITNRVYRNHLSRIKEIAPEAGRSVSLLYRISF